MRDLLLVLHIIGVAVWLGANAVQAFAGAQAASADREVRAWWADTQGALGRVLYNVAGVLILITGVGLVVRSGSVWSFADLFVGIGFLAVVIGAVLGMAVFGPGSRRLGAAIRGGDDAAEQALNTRLQAFGIVDTLVVVTTIVAMVAKWGVG